MLSNERQDRILRVLQKKRTATVRELAALLYVSDATVRRDLLQMQELGVLKRSHGGAVLLEAADEISIFVRMTENASEKERAATNALKALPHEYKTLFLDSSSTVLALAQRLNLSGKTVVTNGLQTAVQLAKIRDIHLVFPGGNVSATGTSVSGGWTINLLRDFRFDLMLSSCAAIDPSGAYETSLEQREVKRTVFSRAARKILIADHTKFGTNAQYFFNELSAFDSLVFDELSPAQRAALDGLPVVCG